MWRQLNSLRFPPASRTFGSRATPWYRQYGRAAVTVGTVATVCTVTWLYNTDTFPDGLAGIRRRRTLQCLQEAHVPPSAASMSAYERWKRDKVGFYENRLRMYSHPLKVFQYFASICDGPPGHGPYYMTPADFIRSLLPYSAISQSQDAVEQPHNKEWLVSVADISAMADTDGDGRISFDEYLFFITVLSTPENFFELAFKILDKDGNDRLDYGEFARLIGSHSTSINERIGSREKVIEVVSGPEPQLSGMMAKMFGRRGDKQLSYKDFAKFVKALQHDLLRCEFYQHVSAGSSNIGVKEFACSVLTYSHPNKLDQYMKKIDTLAESKDRITFKQFEAFDRVTDNMSLVSQAVSLFSEVEGQSDGGLNRPQLKRVLFLASGAELSDTQIDVLFHLFDENGDGFVNADELVGALRCRSYRGLDQPRDLGFWRKLESVWKCMKGN